MKKVKVGKLKVTDYHDFTTKNMSTAKRRFFDTGDWWMNSAQCKKCGEVLVSRNRHDFVTCKCGAVSVDGGSWYLRRVGDLKAIKELSVPFRYIKNEKEK